jgi:hypothetical protein
MAALVQAGDGERMNLSLRSPTNIAGSAQQLQRAVADLQQRASSHDTVPALPATLADLEESLDRLAASMVKTAQAVEEWAGATEADLDRDALSPDARALRWHLFHIASRIRGVQDACPDARRWARELLRESHAPVLPGREGSV